MKIDEVAGGHKSTAAIRIVLSRESSLSTALNQAKNRFGRRLYFRTEQIADLIFVARKLKVCISAPLFSYENFTGWVLTRHLHAAYHPRTLDNKF